MQVAQILKTWQIYANTLFAEVFGGLALNGGLWRPLTTIVQSAAPVPNVARGDAFVITLATNVALVFGAPTNPPPTGFFQSITITIRNTSGGAHGAITWDAIYKTAVTPFPAIATGKNRSITFQWDGTNWVETSESAADVSN